jgi:hypothetical protein
MKTKLFIAAMALLGTLTLGAQPRQGGNENPEDRQAKRESMTRIQALKIADELAFDESTTTKFTDVYLACQKEIWALGPAKDKSVMEDGIMTEAEAEAANKAQFERSQKVLDIRVKYYKEYSKFLSQKQIYQVYKIEKKMRNDMAHKKGKGGPRGNGGPMPGQKPGRD